MRESARGPSVARQAGHMLKAVSYVVKRFCPMPLLHRLDEPILAVPPNRDADKCLDRQKSYNAAPDKRQTFCDVIEDPLFFIRDDVQLFGMIHSPAGAPDPIAYVISHPFGEEKLWSHRVAVSFARELAQRGHFVLRFDYSGAGDSGGDTADISLTTHKADLVAAIGTLEEFHPEVRKIGLVGLRLGASVAALVAEDSGADNRLIHLGDAPLILWDPVLDGDAYIQELLRSNLSTQLALYGSVRENREALTDRIRTGDTVNVDGYEIGKPMLESFGAKNLLTSSPKRHTGPTLVLQISATTSQKEREDLKNFAKCYGSSTFARVTEQPFWREIRKFYGHATNLQELTLDWLGKIDV